jgi:uncharacterized protein with GYD domain
LIRFTEQGAKALKKSTSRATAFNEAAARAGVKVEAQYWTVGAYDGLLVLSSDKTENVIRCLATLAESGNVRTETLQAFDAREFDAILGQ